MLCAFLCVASAPRGHFWHLLLGHSCPPVIIGCRTAGGWADNDTTINFYERTLAGERDTRERRLSSPSHHCCRPRGLRQKEEEEERRPRLNGLLDKKAVCSQKEEEEEEEEGGEGGGPPFPLLRLEPVQTLRNERSGGGDRRNRRRGEKENGEVREWRGSTAGRGGGGGRRVN